MEKLKNSEQEITKLTLELDNLKKEAKQFNL